MFLLKNNSGFSVMLPFAIGGVISLDPKQSVKASAQEYTRLKGEFPLVLKGLMVFKLGKVSAPPAAKVTTKKKAKKSPPKKSEKELPVEKADSESKEEVKADEQTT